MRFAKNSNLFLRNFKRNYKFNYRLLFITLLQKNGKKNFAINIVSKFFLMINKKYKNKLIKNNLMVIDFFQKVFDYYCPKVGFRKKKVAGQLYMLPIYIILIRRRIIFLRWFIQSACKRSEKNILLKLVNEFNDIASGVGRTIRKTEEYYELALKNRPFLHFLKKKKKYRKKYKKFKL